METNHSIIIKDSIYRMINEQITQYDLKQRLIEYVEYQSVKGFPFGELVVLHYKMFNGPETEEIYKIAGAVEMLILQSDILDDFEDGDFSAKPWYMEKNLALNAASALPFLCFKTILNSNFKNRIKIAEIVMKNALDSIHGQHKDLLNICRSEKDYINMTMEKSGSLVALACLTGAVLAAGECPAEVETYSKIIGLIGQLNNDLKDIDMNSEKNDLLNRKYSLPIIYLLHFKDQEISFIHDYFEGKLDKNQIIKKQTMVEKKFEETGAVKYVEVIKKIYQNKALAEIRKLNFQPCYINELLKNFY